MAKILVVEDEHDLAMPMKDWLTREQHVVEIVDNGTDALSRLKVYKYDVVVLDLMLPGMNGIEICRRYRSEGGTSSILMLTDKNTVEDKESGLDAGADDYLTKP